MAGLTATPRASEVYFPHYGVGNGLSTIFIVIDPTDLPARGTLSFFDRDGKPQALPFEEGLREKLEVDLPAHGSVTIQTRSEGKVATGFAQLKIEGNESVTGVAVFRFSNGLEASVLAVAAVERISIPVRLENELNTGIAVMRTGSADVTLELFDSSGQMLRSTALEIPGKQRAAFLNEIFQDLTSVSGTLVVSSAEPIAAVGLRFGGSILSTVPSNLAMTYEQGMLEVLRKPSGMWVFVYQVGGTTFDDSFSFFDVDHVEGNFFAFGLSDSGNEALSGYSSEEELYRLVTSGLLLDEMYEFSLDPDGMAAGCYRFRMTDSGDEFSDCFPLVGQRFRFRDYSNTISSLAPSLKLIDKEALVTSVPDLELSRIKKMLGLVKSLNVRVPGTAREAKAKQKFDVLQQHP